MDRSQRLREALSDVFNLAEAPEQIFKKNAINVWNGLRRGISDTKRTPEALNDFPEDHMILTWEFICRLFEGHPRFSRQVFDSVSVLVDSKPWLDSFAKTKNQGRLQLWKIDLPKRPTDVSPVDVIIKLIKAGASAEDLIKGGEHSDVCRALASRAEDEIPSIMGLLPDIQSDECASVFGPTAGPRDTSPVADGISSSPFTSHVPAFASSTSKDFGRPNGKVTQGSNGGLGMNGFTPVARAAPQAGDDDALEETISPRELRNEGENSLFSSIVSHGVDDRPSERAPAPLIHRWLQPETNPRQTIATEDIISNSTQNLNAQAYVVDSPGKPGPPAVPAPVSPDIYIGQRHEPTGSKVNRTNGIGTSSSSSRGTKGNGNGTKARQESPSRTITISGGRPVRRDDGGDSSSGIAASAPLSSQHRIRGGAAISYVQSTSLPGLDAGYHTTTVHGQPSLAPDTYDEELLHQATATNAGGGLQQERMDDLKSAMHANDNQVNILRNQVVNKATEGITTQKDIVDSLLDAASQALDVASQCLKPMLMGYQGESNPAHVAKERVMECKSRLQDLSANIVIIGPCQSGKTSLCHVLVGYPLLPFEVPTMIVTKWTHIVGRKLPRLTISDALYELLEDWRKRLGFQESLPKVCEGDSIGEAIHCAHKIVYFGRQTGTLQDTDLSPLCRVENFLDVELAFASLDDVSDDLTDVGTLSLYDLPSPDGQIFEQYDLKMVFFRTLQQADGVLVTIDVSKHEKTQVARISSLIEECLEDRLFRREDTWIVANAIDKIDDFHCYEGVSAVCQRVKKEQYRNFESVILDEDHVIPTAAHLNLLALVGKNKITGNIGAANMNKFRYVPWFAQLCHYYHGVNWIRQMRTGGGSATKWQEMVDEVAVHGQVTTKLCTCVLQTAYLNMFPRSVISVMSNMKDIVEDFLQTLDTLQGDDKENGGHIDSSELKQVFNTYFNDVKKKTNERILMHLPRKEDCETYLSMLPEKTMTNQWSAKFESGRGATFEDYTSDPVEDFLKRASRELVAQWRLDFQTCPEDCAEIVKKSHVKWERSVDHYLKKMGAAAISRKRIIDATSDLRISSPKGSIKTLGEEKWNALVKEQTEQVPYRKFKQLFRRTRKVYELSPYTMNQFLENLWELWCREARMLVKQMVLDVVRANFDDMIEAIELVNEKQDMAQLKEGIDFDFGFADELRTILPKVATFDVEDPDTVDDDELERCEELCAEVKRAVNRIILTANFGNGLDRNSLGMPPEDTHPSAHGQGGKESANSPLYSLE